MPPAPAPGPFSHQSQNLGFFFFIFNFFSFIPTSQRGDLLRGVVVGLVGVEHLLHHVLHFALRHHQHRGQPRRELPPRARPRGTFQQLPPVLGLRSKPRGTLPAPPRGLRALTQEAQMGFKAAAPFTPGGAPRIGVGGAFAPCSPCTWSQWSRDPRLQTPHVPLPPDPDPFTSQLPAVPLKPPDPKP